eukprot:529618_1
MSSAKSLYMCLALGLTILGSIGNALGYVIQKKGHLLHIELNEKREIQDEDPQSILSNCTWVSGFIICLIGSILTMTAFKFGAQSVLAPLSALVLVCNAILANKLLGEPFTRNSFYGIVLVIIGSVMAVIFGPKSSTAPVTLLYIETCWRNWIFLIFFTLFTIIAITDYALLKIFEQKNAASIELSHTITHGRSFMMISYISLAAYCGSVNVLFMKSLMIIIGSFDVFYFRNYLFYVTIVGIIIVNVALEYFRQTAIKFFDASYVVPIFQVQLILGASMMGAIFFGEFASLSNLELSLFVIAIVITVFGVAVLAFNLGAVYKKMLTVLNTKSGDKERKALRIRSHRTKALEHFAKRTRRQTSLVFPTAFYGGASAIGSLYNCITPPEHKSDKEQ